MTRVALVGAFTLIGIMIGGVSAQQPLPRLHIQASNISSGDPVSGVQFSVNVHSSVSGRTDNTGKTEVFLAGEVQPGTSVDIILVPSKYRIFSPWSGRIVVPPFGSDTPISVFLLEDGKRVQIGTLVITTVAEKVVDSSVSPAIGSAADLKKQRKAVLAKIAQETRIGEEELESAIRAFSSADPYALGLMALYQGQYPEAVKNLSAALEHARSDRAAPEKVMNAGVFLGHAQCLAGDYQKAATAYRQAADAVPNDPRLLNGLAMALKGIGDFSGAEAQLRRVVEIRQRESPGDSEDLAIAFTNLGFVLQERQKCEEAEDYVLRAFDIWKTKLLDVDERLATANGNVANAKYCKGDYAGGAEYSRQALVVWKRLFGPTALYADKLNDYARTMYRAEQYDLAEPAFREALAIWDQKSVNRSDVIWTLRYLGNIRFQAKDYGAAEELYGRALNEQAGETGIDSVAQVGIYEALTDVYEAKHDTEGEERCYIRILAIRNKEPASSSRDRNIAIVTANLGVLYYNRGDYQRAKPWLEDAARRLDKASPGIVNVQKALDNITNMNTVERAKPR